MKLVWSPEMALKAYIDTVKTCKKFQESDDAEMISAMAGGWNPRLIVEAWSSGSEITTSIGLEIAARHSGARYVCILQNECSRSEYIAALKEHGSTVPELMVGESMEVMERLPEVEFMVVDGGRKDLSELFGVARLSHRGAVLLCRGGRTGRRMGGFRWDLVVKKACLVRSVIIPVGQGLNIGYVKENLEYKKSSSKNDSRWITRIDRKTGEEHVFRG
ncbi:uncharacterized protein LOC111916100 [Lactuca sativa]|uniref:Uncharacterized protein n=1 Tax=Lactuca sativa TaxID=4236 RepID=A0A9R1VSL6_LACSA|nr:uncharacterized protein LOC111916100 [Lactuca sativa]KAJ0211243.1 hypothetical protein LSAT_V11C400174060 [Lactuca sativa]